MLAKKILSDLSRFIGCARFPADKLLGNNNYFLLLQSFKVACQVTVSQAEKLFQGIEINGVVHHECRHDSKPDPAFKNFLKV